MPDDEHSVSPASGGPFASSAPGEPPVYQFRVELREVKPVVWRRVHVLSDMTLDDFHILVQCAMGWDDRHLQWFRIHGRDYGSGSHLSRTTRLDALRLKPGERFFYGYNPPDGWAHDVRLESVLIAERRRHYPVCIAGRHAGPPEWCCGPQEYESARLDAMGLAYIEDLERLWAPFDRAAANAALRETFSGEGGSAAP